MRFFDFVHAEPVAERTIILESRVVIMCFDKFNQVVIVTTTNGTYLLGLPDLQVVEFIPTSEMLISGLTVAADGSILGIEKDKLRVHVF
jgi:hypothetical protein